MSSKTVPVSVRLTHEDAEFLSSLKISGANTPSDKLRAIISENRRRNTEKKDYQLCFQEIQKFILPAVDFIRRVELENEMHSELVTRSFEWLPDLIAFLVSTTSKDSGENSSLRLRELEQGLSDRLFRIMESILQMGASKWFHCYDPETMDKRSGPLLELVKLITEIKTNKEKE